MSEETRARAQRLARESIERGDPTGWFETVYTQAGGDASHVQWADLRPNPGLVDWADRQRLDGNGERALVIGCGLGDDAEELARRGFRVLAFDVAPTAIAWCRSRFQASHVDYRVADLLAAPGAWDGAFHFVLEAYTLQVLPPNLREAAIERIARCVMPGGTLLVIARGREPSEDPGSMPWPLTREELSGFRLAGLTEAQFEEYLDGEQPPVRRFRVEYRR